MLEKIEWIFPKNQENIELFHLMSHLFKDIDYVKVQKEQEIYMQSDNLTPAIIFKLDDVKQMQWKIGDEKYIYFLNRKTSQKERQYEGKILSPKMVLTKLVGHVLRIDHIGINFPASLYSTEEWDDLLQELASISNLYEYPTGEPWPFLLPTTREEKEKEITDFKKLREPRIEFVYDQYTEFVAMHFDIETDLSKAEVEKLFPKEEGVYFENLENSFKAIYLAYNPFMDIRIDVRFKCVHDDFESGKWFVLKGKKI